MVDSYSHIVTIGVPAILVGVTWFAVLLRCFVKARIVKKFTVDDWFLIAALVSFHIP
jgi:hypothetical protein